MQKHYNERNFTHYEDMPRELIDMCLECRRARCSGNCRAYEKRERECNRDSPMLRSNTGRRGLAGKLYPFRGERITASEMAKALGRHPSTIHYHLRRGMTMEDIYRFYEHRHG